MIKVWSELKTGKDGLTYSVRYLLSDDEIRGLQSAGLIGPVSEIVGMQEAADSLMASYEKEQHQAGGGLVQ